MSPHISLLLRVRASCRAAVDGHNGRQAAYDSEPYAYGWETSGYRYAEPTDESLAEIDYYKKGGHVYKPAMPRHNHNGYPEYPEYPPECDYSPYHEEHHDYYGKPKPGGQVCAAVSLD